MKNQFLNAPVAVLLLGALTLGSCSKSENISTSESGVESKYFISAQGEGGRHDYLITADDLTQGSISIAGNGKEVRSGYTWIFPSANSAVGFIYQKGDPGIGLGIGLDNNGKVVPKGSEFQIESRFTTYGVCNGLAITAVSGMPTADDKLKMQSIFNIVNPANKNAKITKEYVTTNMTGNGEFFTFSGIVDAGNGEFLTSMVPSKTLPTSGGGASTGDSDHPDSVWVAKFDTNLKLKKIYKDDRLPYSSGRYRSQYYSQIANDDRGNTYVFSGAFNAKTSKKAGVIRINKGTENFDKNFYWDIETASGGYYFMKVWHISGDYFLLNFYNKKGSRNMTDGITKYAVVNVTQKSFRWLTNGFPTADKIIRTSNAFAADGKAFLPITVENQKPAVYVIDPVTATAKRGLEVQAEAINGLGKLSTK